MRDWLDHKAKFADAVKRVQALVSVAEIVRLIPEEMLPEIRQAVTRVHEGLVEMSTTVQDYEGFHRELTAGAERFVEETRAAAGGNVSQKG